MITRIRPLLSITLSGLLVLSACGKNDGSASSNTSATNSTPSPAAATTNTTGSTAAVATATATTTIPPSVFNVPDSQSLSVADVQKIISRAVAEATAQGKPAVIAVVDRVGNVLAVYTMAGAPANAT